MLSAPPKPSRREGSVSKLHFDPLSSELHLFGPGLVHHFDHEAPRSARPLLHALLGFQGQAAGGLIPAKANPHHFRAGAIAVAETLAVVVIEREAAVGPGIHPERRWFGHGLPGVLADRIEWDDGARPRV